MKKLFLIALIAGTINNVYAGSHFHDWPDDSICGWVKQQPKNEGYLTEARKRGLSCNGLVTGANKTTKSASSDAGTKVTNKLGYPDGELREPKSYSIFSSQASYFKKLVKNGMYLSAQKLFIKHKNSYFNKKSVWGEVPYNNLKKEFLEAASGVLTTFEPEIQVHLDRLEKVNLELKKSKSIPESKWSEYKKLIDENSRMSQNYRTNTLVQFVIRKERKFNPSLKNKVYKEGEKFKSLAKEYADSAFGKYDIINNDNFFNLYPVRLSTDEKKKIINLNLKYILSELDKLSSAKAKTVIKNYKFDTIKSKLRLELIAIQFSKYDILNQQDFFSNYRLTGSDKNKVIGLNSTYILSQIDKASLEQATSLIKRYKLNDPIISFSSKLSGILLEKSIGNKKDLSVLDVVNTLKSLTAVNSNAKDVLPAKYQIAVLNIVSDYEKEPKIASSTILNSPTKDINIAVKSPYIITIQSRTKSLDRSDDNVNKVQSQYKSSSSMVRNSSYSSAQSAVQRANNQYQSVLRDFETLKAYKTDGERDCRQQAESRNKGTTRCSGDIDNNGSFSSTCREGNDYSVMNYNSCMSGLNLALALNDYSGTYNRGTKALQNAKSQLNRANSKLASTPSQISKDNFTSYSFSTRAFEVTKNIERVVFLINNNLNTYSVFTIPDQEKQAFVFASGLDRSDKTHRQNKYQNEDDVEIFVNKPDSFSIEQLIAEIPKEHLTKELEAPIEKVLEAIQYAFNEVTKKSNSQQEQSQESSTSSQQDSSNSDDYIEKIKQAKSLLDSGIISQEEFDKIKQKIIDNI